MATSITRVTRLNDKKDVPLIPVLSFTGFVDSEEESIQDKITGCNVFCF